ncbi:hypothetical protein [Methylobacterium aquaticum]|uniref:hypothetical protein n=1 Tax=Methylobacterium aquaticum TaxID=270351 RepID=UPI0012E14433|nr:hypothetical protein [Methylobacterium aquaticum]
MVGAGEADPDAWPAQIMLGAEPAAEDRPGGWPYFIRRDAPVEPGGCPLHMATGIQRLADAQLLAAAPDLAERRLALLTAPTLGLRDRDAGTRAQAERQAAEVAAQLQRNDAQRAANPGVIGAGGRRDLGPPPARGGIGAGA